MSGGRCEKNLCAKCQKMLQRIAEGARALEIRNKFRLMLILAKSKCRFVLRLANKLANYQMPRLMSINDLTSCLGDRGAGKYIKC